MDGYATPSPIPITPRTASRAGKLPEAAAMGVMMVKSDQISTPIARTALGHHLVARYPPAKFVTVYPRKKAEDIAPCVDASQCSSADIGRMATDMADRSSEQMQDTAAVRPTSARISVESGVADEPMELLAFSFPPLIVAWVSEGHSSISRLPRDLIRSLMVFVLLSPCSFGFNTASLERNEIMLLRA